MGCVTHVHGTARECESRSCKIWWRGGRYTTYVSTYALRARPLESVECARLSCVRGCGRVRTLGCRGTKRAEKTRRHVAVRLLYQRYTSTSRTTPSSEAEQRGGRVRGRQHAAWPLRRDDEVEVGLQAREARSCNSQEQQQQQARACAQQTRRRKRQARQAEVEWGAAGL